MSYEADRLLRLVYEEMKEKAKKDCEDMDMPTSDWCDNLDNLELFCDIEKFIGED